MLGANNIDIVENAGNEVSWQLFWLKREAEQYTHCIQILAARKQSWTLVVDSNARKF